ncbi:hypothetical protein [Bordetella genomosp. 13]|uniref:hypothetical protein n=1 Tax=Bordetella genomosp. 13 TaxID=463040 RepID=UPI0011A6AC86|nr:hypothetical protein [Bordetella genomosp. 13]
MKTRLLPKETDNVIIVTVEIYGSVTEIRDIKSSALFCDGSTEPGSFISENPGNGFLPGNEKGRPGSSLKKNAARFIARAAASAGRRSL